MATSVNSEEVIQTDTLTPHIQDIKKELCDEDLTLRLDKLNNFDFESFHDNMFRTLSEHFTNKSNINEINDACLKLENCFIENNILDKNGLTKPNLKGPPNSFVFLKCRDIDDAFVNMVISESDNKFNKNNKCPPKKIDLKHFKDNFFSFDFNDYDDNDCQSSDSDSESFVEHSQFDIDIADSYNSDIESSLADDGDISGPGNLDNSGNPSHDSHLSLPPLNRRFLEIRDVRVMVEKLQCNGSDRNNVEDNLPRGMNSSKSYGTKIKQVARKKTGGMVINTNTTECYNKELKNDQPQKEDNLVPDGFDKMTRSDRRKLEKIIAESKENLATPGEKIVSEKNGLLSYVSYEKKSNATVNVEELDTPSVEKELDNISDKMESASTSNVKESNSSSNEKELDDTSNEDKLNENELLKSVVTNTILDFLIKSKGLKIGKEKVDLISDEITKKLSSFIPDEEINDADDPAIINAEISSTEDNKMEDSVSVKSNEAKEESSSTKKPNPPKKRTTKRNTSSANNRKRLQEFQEIARDIINCKLSTPLVDELEEFSRPTTRQSLVKSDREVQSDDVPEEPRRPVTRRSIAKNDKDKVLAVGELEEPRKPTTRQSVTKINTDVLNDDVHEEPRRPVTRKSLTKNDKVLLSNELPKETKRQSNTTANKSPEINDKVCISDEETKTPVSNQLESNNDTVNVIDVDDSVDEEPKRPVTRQSLAKNDKDILIIDLEKEEPKKHITRKTVAELERSKTLGSMLTPVDNEIVEPSRRTTRSSLQKQKGTFKDSNEASLFTDDLIPDTTISKRKNNARTKKNPTKKSVKKQKVGKKMELEASDNTSIDAVINDDSVSASDSDASKLSRSTDCSFFSDNTILKASADSTTVETEPCKESAENSLITADEENLHHSPTTTNIETDVMEVSEKNDSPSLTSVTELTLNKSDNIHGEKNDGEVHSQSENDVERVCLPDTSILVSSLANTDSNHFSDTSDDSLKNVSKLVEDLLDESIKDRFSTSQESPGLPFKTFTAILHPSTVKKPPQPVDEPFQILNDMITDIEERLLKEESEEASKDNSESVVCKDIDANTAADKDSSICPSVTIEVSADSTSFLNYTMDDSFKLMIDESTPHKENTIKENASLDLLSSGSKENNSERNLETFAEPAIVSSASSSKKEPSKEEKEDSEVPSLKEAEKDVEKTHSQLPSIDEDVNSEAVMKSKKEVKISGEEEKKTEKLEEELIGQKILPPASASIDQKSLSLSKPLTNEEKIAQLTKRDPRLLNDKKISNVILRDPRLRNKQPKIEEKHDNVIIAEQNSSDSNISEEKVKIPELVEPKITEVKLPEILRTEIKKSDEQKTENSDMKIFDKKNTEEKSSEQKLVVAKISEPKITSCLPQVNIVSLLRDLGDTPEEILVKPPVQIQKSVRSDVLDYNSEQNRKKKLKKTIDEELLYKTPLSDLHDTHTERSTYEREKDFKKKKLFPEGRRVRIITEERGRTFTAAPRRVRTVDEPNEEKREYNHSAPVSTNTQNLFRRESQEEMNLFRPNSDLHANRRYTEELRFREENLTYEQKTYYHEKREILPSGSNETYGQGSYVRRMVTETSYSETFHNRNDLQQDNHIYSRREFYRRNRYAHDHDHVGYSSRLLETSNNDMRRENETYNQNTNSHAAAVEPSFSISTYAPVSCLPEPMYSQEEDLDQSYGNMETESFSPPSADLCPPPPLIRSPTSEFGRRDKYCPSPPRIGSGRRNSNDERDYDEYNRVYHNRNYENDDRTLRGRNNDSSSSHSNARGGGNFRRGNGREHHHRWREESPPRKRFAAAAERFRGHDNDRGGGGSRNSRWRRSPSWSPERPRRWSRERSPIPPLMSSIREPPPQHPWNSPREAHPWDSPPRDRPWNSPPRNRSPSPQRRRDNYRDRSAYYHRY